MSHHPHLPPGFTRQCVLCDDIDCHGYKSLSTDSELRVYSLSDSLLKFTHFCATFHYGCGQYIIWAINIGRIQGSVLCMLSFLKLADYPLPKT